MNRQLQRTAAMLLALGMVAAGCSDDGVSIDTTSTTAAAVTTTMPPPTTAPTTTTLPEPTTTTTTLPPLPNATLAEEGDTNEAVEAFQFLLNCYGLGELTVDGAFGPATRSAVREAQSSLGQEVDGAADEDLLRALSRWCGQSRRVAGAGQVRVVGNADPEDPEVFTVGLLGGASLGVGVAEGSVTVTLADGDGTPVEPVDEAGTWVVDEPGDYRLFVVPTGEDPETFTLVVGLSAAAQGEGWILGTDEIAYGDTTLELGDDAGTVIDTVYDILGHEVRGRYAEFDTEWSDEPGNIGIRGVFIEGLAFLFWGPSTDYPGQAEQLARIRFEGPGYDAAGEPRPANYVTTAEGVTVGNTLGQLKAAYGAAVKAGSNDEEHYYRYADSRGELCFYFGAAEPKDSSVITEIATECRD